jgi:hypothetical protein
MEISLQTPALLFPALSLLFIGYTNKFLALASLIRRLIEDYENAPDRQIIDQIRSLRRRVMLIRWMQATGVGSILFCVLTMFFVYSGHQNWAKGLFGTSLLLMIVSLFFSLIEIFLSAGALRLLLENLEKKNLLD